MGELIAKLVGAGAAVYWFICTLNRMTPCGCPDLLADQLSPVTLAVDAGNDHSGAAASE